MLLTRFNKGKEIIKKNQLEILEQKTSINEVKHNGEFHSPNISMRIKTF